MCTKSSSGGSLFENPFIASARKMENQKEMSHVRRRSQTHTEALSIEKKKKGFGANIALYLNSQLYARLLSYHFIPNVAAFATRAAHMQHEFRAQQWQRNCDQIQ
jgi:hypothetical protein